MHNVQFHGTRLLIKRQIICKNTCIYIAISQAMLQIDNVTDFFLFQYGHKTWNIFNGVEVIAMQANA